MRTIEMFYKAGDGHVYHLGRIRSKLGVKESVREFVQKLEVSPESKNRYENRFKELLNRDRFFGLLKVGREIT